MRLRTYFSISFISLCTQLAVTANAQEMPDFDKVEIRTTDLGNGIYLLQGVGGNLGVSVGEDGVFLIDDEFAELTPKIIAALGEITDQPVRYLINTHWHLDHTGGNQNMAATGAVIVAHDNVRVRMGAPGERQSPPDALPVITFSESTTFHYNGHEIHVSHPLNAHTDGDAMVHFRDIDVIHTGDVFFNGLYPFIDLNSGGSIDGYLAALQQLADMAGPDTVIIPGHGPVASRSDVETKIAMLQDATARISELIAEGKTLEEVQAADPLAVYSDTWAWMFIDGNGFTEILYTGLQSAQ